MSNKNVNPDDSDIIENILNHLFGKMMDDFLLCLISDNKILNDTVADIANTNVFVIHIDGGRINSQLSAMLDCVSLQTFQRSVSFILS